MASFKVCANCGAISGLRRRVCPNCGKGQGRSIFRAPTTEEIKSRDDRHNEMVKLICEMGFSDLCKPKAEAA